MDELCFVQWYEISDETLFENNATDQKMNCVKLRLRRNAVHGVLFEASRDLCVVPVEFIRDFVLAVPKYVRVSSKNINSLLDVALSIYKIKLTSSRGVRTVSHEPLLWFWDKAPFRGQIDYKVLFSYLSSRENSQKSRFGGQGGLLRGILNRFDSISLCFPCCLYLQQENLQLCEVTPKIIFVLLPMNISCITNGRSLFPWLIFIQSSFSNIITCTSSPTTSSWN